MSGLWHDNPSTFSALILTNKDIMVDNHNIIMTIRKLTMTYHYHLIHRSYSSFTSCLNNILYYKRIQTRIIQRTELLNLFHFFPFHLSSLFFPWILKITGMLFCKITLNLSLSDVSSWLDLSYGIIIFGRNKTEVKIYSLYPNRWYTNLICLITNNVYFD